MTDRRFTTGLYLLRCFDVGLRLEDLTVMNYGTVLDIITEKSNDGETYQEVATQSDFDRF